MNRSGRHKINAFTIFEVTTVLAIMSVLLTIIFLAANRFSEQLKVANDVTSEMNEWRLVRSTIWRDFYSADSIQCHENVLTIYVDGKALIYDVKNEQLHRENNGIVQNLKFEVASMYETFEQEHRTFFIDFLWKGETMTLSYFYNPAIDLEINNYFDLIE